jgi:hypothetical protein
MSSIGTVNSVSTVLPLLMHVVDWYAAAPLDDLHKLALYAHTRIRSYAHTQFDAHIFIPRPSYPRTPIL